ncbi:MAG TPA: hypothetical protein VFB21_03120, partial [Chthonomonadaceae bacterium]|nr:hypothetical protein [Chthonomonadaceae bacterium]
RIQAGFGVEATVEFYAEVCVGKMHYTRGAGHFVPFTSTEFYCYYSSLTGGKQATVGRESAP